MNKIIEQFIQAEESTLNHAESAFALYGDENDLRQIQTSVYVMEILNAIIELTKEESE